jgi:bifunctional UDP-N-acetylglucosamine pyrophosphorylase/glucosamine-1-phosphate N-acetyltransferase/UDP-N-acetylglucosamine pyrophosphorylase
MSTYLFDAPDLIEALGQIGNANLQKEYYLTDCAAVLRELGRSVIALPVLQPCEALSINDPAELELVDRTMRSMGYSVVTA